MNLRREVRKTAGKASAYVITLYCGCFEMIWLDTGNGSKQSERFRKRPEGPRLGLFHSMCVFRFGPGLFRTEEHQRPGCE